MAGHAIEKYECSETVYDVTVRMHDGTLRTFRQSTSSVIEAKVRVEADSLHSYA